VKLRDITFLRVSGASATVHMLLKRLNQFRKLGIIIIKIRLFTATPQNHQFASSLNI